MLEARADVQACLPTGWTALMFAAHGGHADVAEALLGAGARQQRVPLFKFF